MYRLCSARTAHIRLQLRSSTSIYAKVHLKQLRLVAEFDLGGLL